jgi:ribosomal protein S18 acetylase RimI-like enzyme
VVSKFVSIQIRQAALHDLEPMLRWRAHTDAMRTAITRDLNAISAGKVLIFKATSTNDLVGTVQLVRQHADPDLARDAAYLSALEVHRDHRRQSIAKQLINTLESTAKTEGLSRVTTMVEPNNIASRELCKRLEYKVFKDSAFEWDGQNYPVVCLEKLLS